MSCVHRRQCCFALLIPLLWCRGVGLDGVNSLLRSSVFWIFDGNSSDNTAVFRCCWAALTLKDFSASCAALPVRSWGAEPEGQRAAPSYVTAHSALGAGRRKEEGRGHTLWQRSSFQEAYAQSALLSRKGLSCLLMRKPWTNCLLCSPLFLPWLFFAFMSSHGFPHFYLSDCLPVPLWEERASNAELLWGQTIVLGSRGRKVENPLANQEVDNRSTI